MWLWATRTLECTKHKPRLDKQPLEPNAHAVGVRPLRAGSRRGVAMLKPLGCRQAVAEAATAVEYLTIRSGMRKGVNKYEGQARGYD